MGCLRDDVHAQAFKKPQAFAADDGHIDIDAFITPLGHRINHLAKQIDVEAATKAAITGNHDEAHALDLASLGIAVLILKVSLCQVRHYITHLPGVGASLVHPLLGATHLARSDHLHRFCDLLSILDTLDLGPDFLGACHIVMLRELA